RGYLGMGVLVGLIPIPRLADAWCRRALEIAEKTSSPQDLAWVLSRVAVHSLMTCRWAEADAVIARATALTEQLGDLRLWEECRQLAGASTLYSGRFERALAHFADGHRGSQRSGNKQVECWA